MWKNRNDYYIYFINVVALSQLKECWSFNPQNEIHHKNHPLNSWLIIFETMLGFWHILIPC